LKCSLSKKIEGERCLKCLIGLNNKNVLTSRWSRTLKPQAVSTPLNYMLFV